MLHTIVTPSPKVNQSQVKLNYFFVPMPQRIDDTPVHAQAERTLRRLIQLIRRRGGKVNWSVTQMAEYCRVSVRTFQRHQNMLEEAGELLIERPPRQLGCRRSPTNIYRLGNGSGVTMGRRSTREKYLKTNTPAVAVAITEPDDDPETTPQDIPAPPAPSYPPPTPAQRRKNHHDHHRSLRRWEHNQRMRKHRLERARHRCRMALQASLGVWRPSSPTPRSEEAQTQLEQQEQRDRSDAIHYWRRMKEKGEAIYRDCPYAIRRILESDEVQRDVAHGATKGVSGGQP